MLEVAKLEVNLLVLTTSRVVNQLSCGGGDPTSHGHSLHSLWREFPTGFEERFDDTSVDPKEVVTVVPPAHDILSRLMVSKVKLTGQPVQCVLVHEGKGTGTFVDQSKHHPSEA